MGVALEPIHSCIDLLEILLAEAQWQKFLVASLNKMGQCRLAFKHDDYLKVLMIFL